MNISDINDFLDEEFYNKIVSKCSFQFQRWWKK